MSRLRKQHMKIFWNNLIDEQSEVVAKKAPLEEKAALVGRLGLMMLSVGAGAYRVRAAMNKVCRAMDISCNADIGLLSIEYTCVSGSEAVTYAISNSSTGVNTDKMHRLRMFSSDFARNAGRRSMAQFFVALDEIEHSSGHYKAPRLGLAAALACGAFTFLLGGGLVEMICAFFGAGVGNFVRKKLLERHITLYANVSVGVGFACFVYIMLIKCAEYFFGISEVHQAGYICSMLFVIPGFPLITGGIDLAKLDLRSGFERILYALLIIFVATITGWVFAFLAHFSPEEFPQMKFSVLTLILFRMAASFAAVYGFSLMFNSTRRMALFAGIIGVISNVFRLELIDFLHVPIYLAAFLAALVAGLLASLLKRFTGYPRLTMTVPSIVIMVPGMFMYRCVYYFAFDSVDIGAKWLIKAALVVCSLCMGLIFARILTDRNFRRNS